ncbi:hypothetical protein DSO57_1035592 [Entomophthora muscae]|uniref:Uncharacterized protein n=1 Tax=Entomophthora muscae TaxID=34485 RepID=A0ACC2SCK5_9FUNG|nr:hypothetical protein DSO57_1035592 [Entomophthora muscae]
MEVKPNNTYLIKGIGAWTELKRMHFDCLRLCKARTAQQNSRLPVPNAKLDQYQAHIPDTLKKIPKALPSSTPGVDVAGTSICAISNLIQDVVFGVSDFESQEKVK